MSVENLLSCESYFKSIAKFCRYEYGKILWVRKNYLYWSWNFDYGRLLLSLRFWLWKYFCWVCDVGSWINFVVVILDMENFWLWFWSWKIFWLWFWSWLWGKKKFGYGCDVDSNYVLQNLKSWGNLQMLKGICDFGHDYGKNFVFPNFIESGNLWVQGSLATSCFVRMVLGRTFHFPSIGEVMLTPYDFSVITGLRLGGERIKINESFTLKEIKSLLGIVPSKLKSKNVSLMWLCENIESCNTIATGTRMFMLLFIGTFLCLDLGSTVSLRYLWSLRDIDQIKIMTGVVWLCIHSILHPWFNQRRWLEWSSIYPKNHDCITCIGLLITYHKSDLEILTIATICPVSKSNRQIKRYHVIKFAQLACIMSR